MHALFLRVGFLGNQTKAGATVAHMAQVMQSMDPSLKAAQVAAELARHGAALCAKSHTLPSRTRFGVLLASHLLFKNMHHFNAFKAQLELVGMLKPSTVLDSAVTADDVDAGIYAIEVQQHVITDAVYDSLRRTFSGTDLQGVMSTLTSGLPYDGTKAYVTCRMLPVFGVQWHLLPVCLRLVLTCSFINI
jgi:hypothetical protein